MDSSAERTMSSDRSTHWCYSCQETVTLQARNATCPNCGGGFIHQLDDSIVSSSSEERSQRPRFMEAVSNFLQQQVALRRGGGASERGPLNGNSWDSFLVFSGDVPVRMPAGGNGGLVEFLNETLGFRQENGGDYFIGPGVEEFFEHVTVNDHRAPPPALRSSIESLSTVTISRKHVRAESTCAVCKERFELGSQVKKLPCKHMYHSDCIVPWLEQRSSCPVCRQVVTGRQTNNGSSIGNSRGRNRSRRRWSFLWPFGSTGSGSDRSQTVEPSPVAYHQDNHHSEYSQWPFEH